MPRPLGLTSLQILAAIRDGRNYGLDIVAATGLASGTVYPGLGRLKEMGLVQAHWEARESADREGRPRRRHYELTAEGIRALVQGRARVAQAADALSPRPGEAG